MRNLSFNNEGNSKEEPHHLGIPLSLESLEKSLYTEAHTFQVLWNFLSRKKIQRNKLIHKIILLIIIWIKKLVLKITTCLHTKLK